VLHLERELKRWRHNDAMSNILRVRLEGATAHRDRLVDEIACMRRLVRDTRMREVYARLVRALKTDDHLSGFVSAAWIARMDYGKYRQQLTAAADLAGEVATAAGLLAGLLRQAEQLDVHFPVEFHRVKSLLLKTEHEPNHRDFRMWQGLRHAVLGAVHPREQEADDAAAPPTIEIKYVATGDAQSVQPEEAARYGLRYAWATAPSLAQIISTLQREALAFVPAEHGFVGAALASRKGTAKTAYLRAFGALLRDEHQIALNTDVKHAMATTATVVIDDADLVVTYDDVNKALARIVT
jgi:hypothetical protein